ncbi:7116b1db-d8ff-4993-afb5-b44fe4d55eee [Sclerotinia trifoliorum]|uniref:Phosphoinositide phospholipase C n=1 Tax=Sclerotinia trifoliorum TaxID=28548 RepID=A0A8H2VU28_9HELO|nr:7116b1db-d8ff-4993-afb5-b44fe4d55eee [Sclerotinia trifoliorum]
MVSFLRKKFRRISTMPLLTPSGKQFSLHKLVAMSTMLTPGHGVHLPPLNNTTAGDPPRPVYLSHEIQEYLRKLFDELRGPEPCLGRERFEKWLADVQGHTITLEKDTYKFEQFLESVYYSHSLEVMRRIPELDQSKPITNYYISSSHNTYLEGNQLLSRSSTEAYKTALTQNCRCIEIDVHNGEAAEKDDKSIFSNKTDHKRQPSGTGSTLSSRAAAAILTVEEKLESAKGKLEIAKEKLEGKHKVSKTNTGDKLKVVDEDEHGGRPASIRSSMIGEPLVLHGWTLTAPVGFRAVCKAIRETAFTTSPLPIIVSLEVHADHEQQEIMVDIMKEEWEGLLLDSPFETCNPEERVPRLEELLNKILVKVKKAPELKDAPEHLNELTNGSTNGLSPTNTDTLEKKASSNTLVPVISTKDAESGHSGSEDDRASSKKRAKICETLGKLGIYTHSEHFVSFDVGAATKPSHIFSVGEKVILELHESNREQMFAHNRNYFMRAFPAGKRFDSSNLDPSVCWRKGIQMVALNWQTLDEGMMLNEGMFAGSQGWILKPPGYRSEDATSESCAAIPYKTLDLKISIFVGQQVPFPQGETEKGFHPYVKCELHVESQEELDGQPIENGGKAKEGEHKLKTAYKSGSKPDYEGETLHFEGIRNVVEELSFVRFKIEDANYSKDELAAWACIRLDRLQQGYRLIPLKDVKGNSTDGLLLVKIEKVLS